MPRYGSYIAKKSDPSFFWDEIPKENWNGNLPKRLFPTEWYDNLGFDDSWYASMLKSGHYNGKQIEWGGWAIEVSKAQCLAIWMDQERGHASSERWKKKWSDIKAKIDGLDEHDQYLIVIVEAL